MTAPKFLGPTDVYQLLAKIAGDPSSMFKTSFDYNRDKVDEIVKESVHVGPWIPEIHVHSSVKTKDESSLLKAVGGPEAKVAERIINRDKYLFCDIEEYLESFK